MKFKKIGLTETVHKYPGTYVDDTTFLDPNGNPYDLQVSDFGNNKPPQPPKTPQKGQIRIDRSGRKKKYVPGFGWRFF